jgi:hypothetical protein
MCTVLDPASWESVILPMQTPDEPASGQAGLASLKLGGAIDRVTAMRGAPAFTE